MREIVLVDPQAGETGLALDDAEPPVIRLFRNEAQQVRMIALRHHDHRAALDHLLVDRAHAVPTPRLDAFTHRVIEHHRDIRLVNVQLRARFRFEFFLGQIVSDERKILARNPVPLRRVAISPIGHADPAHLRSDDDNVAANFLRQIFLKNPAIIYFYCFDHGAPLSWNYVVG